MKNMNFLSNMKESVTQQNLKIQVTRGRQHKQKYILIK